VPKAFVQWGKRHDTAKTSQANGSGGGYQSKNQSPLLADLRDLILQSREGVARAVDSGLTACTGNVGRRIRQRHPQGKAGRVWGADCVRTGDTIDAKFGRGFSRETSSIWCALPRFSRIPELCSHGCTIELDPLLAHNLPGRPAPARLLTPRCAALNAGTSARWKRRSAGCSTSARHCRGSRKNLAAMELKATARGRQAHARFWSSAIPTSSISSG